MCAAAATATRETFQLAARKGEHAALHPFHVQLLGKSWQVNGDGKTVKKGLPGRAWSIAL